MSESAAAIGHNLGPVIDFEDALQTTGPHVDQFLQRQTELIKGFARWKDAGDIEDDVHQGRSGDFVKQLCAEIRIIEAKREELKKPVLSLSRAIDAGFKGVAAPLVHAKETIERAMTVYAQAKAAAERKRIAEEAAREAERVRQANELAALEAEVLGEEAPPEPLPAPVQAVMPSLAEASRVSGDYGTTASLRGRWTYEVVSLDEVPRQFLMLNDAAVKAAIKGGARQIAGINIFQETKIGVR